MTEECVWEREMCLSIISAYFKREVGWKMELQMSVPYRELSELEGIKKCFLKMTMRVVTLSSNGWRGEKEESTEWGQSKSILDFWDILDFLEC